ncbi:uncharacterized protein B0I36DRAFT_387406 [Microdochium trichocladiopsis]|uniref:FAD-binding PCMH-type domain-containing protein n=1 Tax=Microdochium trichocladiopsis TaxID=1682393 RepID=A0A9P8XY95_9PEZI|nr:uncharacterized protein B0I36DRAFT_387406 [Microdochium trichocladiopsis]KAH7025021.1 hypothetical protein B0I36DRAFT_387406 [Microdochium trichocladiopsis]
MGIRARVPPIEIAASPERVREIFLDFDHMSQWHTSHFKSLDIVTPGKKGITLAPGDKMRVNLGGGMNFGANITENSKDRLTWKGGVSYLLVGEHTFEFRPSQATPGGTTFVQYEDFTGLLTFGMKSDQEKTSGGFQRVNEDLKKRAETLVSADLPVLPDGQYPLGTCAQTTIELDLAPVLSDGAAVVFPGDEAWHDLVARASTPRVAPQYIAVVEVATEADVEHTIRFANKHGYPFLAASGSHGWTTALAEMHNGIQINLRRMNSVTVNDDGLTATAGGGILQWEATRALFAKGKMTPTGICACVSVAGPALGGGHGMLQGRHGFAADNLVSARVTLANGTSVTASGTQNPDLFWGLKGAGHNLGVVTSLEMSLYDADELWRMDVLTYTQDKLEQIFAVWNELEDEIADPGLLVAGGTVAWNPALDDKHPIINILLYSAGNATAIERYVAAFQGALGPPAASVTVTDIPYGDVFATGGFGVDSPVCRKDANVVGYPASVSRWDGAGMRAGFELFTELTRQAKYSTSMWLLESFGRKGVRDIDVASAAVPAEERQRHILHAPVLWWDGADEGDVAEVRAWGVKFQEAVRPRDAEKPHSYVNYAMGDESVPEVYGEDPARLQRLRALKREFDPMNRFGFYSPIV